MTDSAKCTKVTQFKDFPYVEGVFSAIKEFDATLTRLLREGNNTIQIGIVKDMLREELYDHGYERVLEPLIPSPTTR